VQALILAGGSGTRFWPLSRRSRPKQLLALEGERSLLQETVERIRPLIPPEDVWVVTTRALAAEVRRQLPEVPAAQVLEEPLGRNTAPAIGWAVRSMPEQQRGDVVAVLPADHRVADGAAFRAALARAAEVAESDDWVLTLGVVPRWAETGYGYLELGEALPDGGEGHGSSEPGPPTVRRVARFVEKPTPERAAEYVASGRYLWNAGIFVFRGTTFLEILERLVPELARGLEALARDPGALDAGYAALPAESIDYAVMEKLDGIAMVATVPLDCGWSDLGSWAALAEVLPEDGAGNAVRGDVVAADASGNLLFADRGTIAVLGVEGLAVVRTGDTVLVIPRERSQDVRRLIAELEARGRSELL
jgi:mannose-1-phosphate guanylyltransferase